jgi:pimeloyl-ACP methyl ester carboxylesterase
MYLAHRFQRSLEKDFVVVQWDRRGAGKSYYRDTPPDKMRVSQEVADTAQLAEQLTARFGQSKLYLVGHSYGSYLGMIVAHQSPRLLHAYVGIGQLAYSGERNREVQDRWIRDQATATGDAKLLKLLDSKGPINREKWLFKFGGELHYQRSFTALLMIGLRAPEYSMMDVLRLTRGLDFTHREMKFDAIDGDLIDAIPRLDVPAYFFTGRFDYTDPFEHTEEYLGRLQAPKKEMVWFDESAHFPFLEEPEKFAHEMRRVATEGGV